MGMGREGGRWTSGGEELQQFCVEVGGHTQECAVVLEGRLYCIKNNAIRVTVIRSVRRAKGEGCVAHEVGILAMLLGGAGGSSRRQGGGYSSDQTWKTQYGRVYTHTGGRF